MNGAPAFISQIRNVLRLTGARSDGETHRPVLWTAGDWNAFFGFGTNILVNMLTLTALLRFVLKMPDAIVFGRILPALGLMMCLSTLNYAWLAYRLAAKTGRTDVCALPSGVGVSITSFRCGPRSRCT
jgi:adenine/guanine/hypoxanthine permease